MNKLSNSVISKIVSASIAAAILIAAAGSSSVGAQDQRQQKLYQPTTATQTSDPAGPKIIVSPGEDYRIGPSDVIEITVMDAPELTRSFRVSSDGSITMPFLGRIAAHKKTPDELSNLIADRLRGDYLQDPQVSIAVLQINSRTYFIQGSVRRPGLYQVEGQPSLLKLITIAGGLSENYGSTAFVIRETKQEGESEVANPKSEASTPKPEQTNESSQNSSEASAQVTESSPEAKPKYELVKVNINGLLRGNFDQNIEIGPGDIIHIPPTDVFFVAGEVNAPGSFPLKDGTTLRQAISLAQGTTFQASGGRAIIFREEQSSGKRQEIPVDVTAVMSGKKSDVPILANDIIIIPNSRLKTVGSTLLKAFGVNSARIPVRYGY